MEYNHSIYSSNIMKDLDYIIEYKPLLFNRESKNNVYYDSATNRYVPRASEVISYIVDQSGLISWANHLGFNSERYTDAMNSSQSIGTNAHKMIDRFLNNDRDGVMSIYNHCKEESVNAFYAFMAFYKKITNRFGASVVFKEHSIVSRYFGGTIDGVFKIEDRYWLVDYKTSNKVRLNHLLQLAAYSLLLEWQYNMYIDNAIILKLDKYSKEYKEYNIDLTTDSTFSDMFRSARDAFMSGLLWYYNARIVELPFYKFSSSKKS